MRTVAHANTTSTVAAIAVGTAGVVSTASSVNTPSLPLFAALDPHAVGNLAQLVSDRPNDPCAYSGEGDRCFRLKVTADSGGR